MRKLDRKLNNRRSIRLKNYDYSKTGRYFITICCYKRKYRFGRVCRINGRAEMVLSVYGQEAYRQWILLPERFPCMKMDEFQIMPDHIHAIITIDNTSNSEIMYDNIPHMNNGSTLPSSSGKKTSISDIIGAYKSLVVIYCLKICKENQLMLGRFWHRNYYERIIRDEHAYRCISKYIRNNPEKWLIKRG